jgi:hypothetical protein
MFKNVFELTCTDSEQISDGEAEDPLFDRVAENSASSLSLIRQPS